MTKLVATRPLRRDSFTFVVHNPPPASPERFFLFCFSPTSTPFEHYQTHEPSFFSHLHSVRTLSDSPCEPSFFLFVCLFFYLASDLRSNRHFCRICLYTTIALPNDPTSSSGNYYLNPNYFLTQGMRRGFFPCLGGDV